MATGSARLASSAPAAHASAIVALQCSSCACAASAAASAASSEVGTWKRAADSCCIACNAATPSDSAGPAVGADGGGGDARRWRRLLPGSVLAFVLARARRARCSPSTAAAGARVEASAWSAASWWACSDFAAASSWRSTRTAAACCSVDAASWFWHASCVDATRAA